MRFASITESTKTTTAFILTAAGTFTSINCDVQCQDDAWALFGSNEFVTIANCSFSTRWSVFRFGGGASQNITVSNCLIYDTYGCPIKISAGEANIENLIFSNIVMKKCDRAHRYWIRSAKAIGQRTMVNRRTTPFIQRYYL